MNIDKEKINKFKNLGLIGDRVVLEKEEDNYIDKKELTKKFDETIYMEQEEFEKLEAKKERKFKEFINRWEIYIKSFEKVGFTKEQARKLAQEFSDLKKI